MKYIVTDDTKQTTTVPKSDVLRMIHDGYIPTFFIEGFGVYLLRYDGNADDPWKIYSGPGKGWDRRDSLRDLLDTQSKDGRVNIVLFDNVRDLATYILEKESKT